MRNPGLWVSDTDQTLPIAYVEFDRGPGEYVLRMPRVDLDRPNRPVWRVLHDFLEDYGELLHDFVDTLRDGGVREFASELHIEMPRFDAIEQLRNARVANNGEPVADGYTVTDPQRIMEAYTQIVAERKKSKKGVRKTWFGRQPRVRAFGMRQVDQRT